MQKGDCKEAVRVRVRVSSFRFDVFDRIDDDLDRLAAGCLVLQARMLTCLNLFLKPLTSSTSSSFSCHCHLAMVQQDEATPSRSFALGA